MKYFGEVEDCSNCPLENTNFCTNTYEKDPPCSREQYWETPLNEIESLLEFEREVQEDFYDQEQQIENEIRRKKEEAKRKAKITRILNSDINTTIRNLRKTIKNLEEIKSMRKSQALLHSIFTNKKAEDVDNTDLDLKINKIQECINGLEQEKKERARRRKTQSKEVQK